MHKFLLAILTLTLTSAPALAQSQSERLDRQHERMEQLHRELQIQRNEQEIRRLESQLRNGGRPPRPSALEQIGGAILRNGYIDCGHWDGSCSAGYRPWRW
jgi:hypothetical protein